MKVLLLRPPYVIPQKSVYGHRGVPPLGLAYLAAALKTDGHEVSCLDGFAEDMDAFSVIHQSGLLANGLTIEKIISRIPPAVEMIGISCMFSNEWIYTSQLIQELKKQFPKVFLVLGGEHVTADYEYILKTFREVDCCILGEGEEKLKNLAKSFAAGEKNLANITGITYFDQASRAVKTNSFPYRIQNIDEIAEPDWESLPLRTYFERGFGFSMQKKRSMPMLLSRGCPYRCTFCSNEKMWTTKWISRDPDLAISEIKKYVLMYQVEHLDFFDLTAVVNRKWTLEFCEKLSREKLGLTWALPSGTRSEALDFEVLAALRKSGCTKITYAPESGSVIMSKKIQKRVNLKVMLHSMKNAVKLGMIVKANIIFGFPDERYRDILWNFVYLFKMAFVGVHDVPCFGFTPYPGSELFRRLVGEGIIKRDENYDIFLAHLVYTSPLDRRSWSKKLPHFALPLLSLGGMAFFYSCQFLMRPQRFLGMIKRVIQNQPQTMLDIALTNLIDDNLKGRRSRQKNKVLKTPAAHQNLSQSV